MTLGEAYRHGIDMLSQHNIADPHIESRVLLCHLLDISHASLYSHSNQYLPQDIFPIFDTLLSRRLKHEPCAYITGKKEFYGNEFYVDNRVLVPRPETELLVDQALEVIDSLAVLKNQPIRIADIGTGSGIIAITLALQCQHIDIFAIDCSPQALEVARLNAELHKIEKRIAFLCGNLLTPLPFIPDVVIANLPYVTDTELANLQPEISIYEPELALRGGTNGLDLIEELFSQISKAECLPAYILLEIGENQHKSVSYLIDRLFPQTEYHFIKDGHGFNRAVQINLTNCN